LTERELRKIAKYIAVVANALGLRDWSLRLHDDEPDDKDAQASVATVYGRKIAHVNLGHGFSMLDPEEQRHVIVHELLHVLMDPTWTLVNQALPGQIGVSAWGVFEAAYRERMEHAVDAIAKALAPALPLPE
jgi:hypothetical protein